MDARADWRDVYGPYCNAETNERGPRFLEFAIFNNLIPWPHKHQKGKHDTAQTGSHTTRLTILVRKRFQSGVNSIGQGAFREQT